MRIAGIVYDDLRELTLSRYQKLERNGTARDLAANHDLSVVQPILDDEIQTAVNALRASTLAIERQNGTLKDQRAALSAFREQDQQTRVRRDARTVRHHRRQEQEKQHVGLAVMRASPRFSTIC